MGLYVTYSTYLRKVVHCTGSHNLIYCSWQKGQRCTVWFFVNIFSLHCIIFYAALFAASNFTTKAGQWQCKSGGVRALPVGLGSLTLTFTFIFNFSFNSTLDYIIIVCAALFAASNFITKAGQWQCKSGGVRALPVGLWTGGLTFTFNSTVTFSFNSTLS